jgi:hypothetical protein
MAARGESATAANGENDMAVDRGGLLHRRFFGHDPGRCTPGRAPPDRPTDLIQGTQGPVDMRVRPNERGSGRPGYQPASPATHIITVDIEGSSGRRRAQEAPICAPVGRRSGERYVRSGSNAAGAT